MGRTVNGLQLKVLRWIAEGCPAGGVPTEGFSYKVSAYALQSRRLVRVDRRGGRWRAEVTDVGRHFLEHGAYPASDTGPGPKRQGKPRQRERLPAASVGSSSEAGGTRPAVDRRSDTGGERPGTPKTTGVPVPIVTQIRRPHPAIRELLDHPKRVDLPAEVRRRVHVVSHTLVGEALRRGWQASAVTSEVRQRWPSGRERWWPSKDLFRIDAGECEVGVQFRVKTSRVEHVATPDEARRRARGEYVWAPRWDYHPTEVLRLFLYHGGHVIASWEDTARIPIENRIVAVLDRVQELTRAVIARRAAEQRRWEEQRRRREEDQRQQARVTHYDAWLDALLTLQRRRREHAELVTLVADLQARRCRLPEEDRAQLDTFLMWADRHLTASNPFDGVDLPAGAPPEMTYAQWRQWKNYFDNQTRRSTLPWPLR